MTDEAQEQEPSPDLLIESLCQQARSAAALTVVMGQRERIRQLEQQLDEALKGRLLVPLWNVERDICRMSTRVSLDLPYCDFDECQDRREFRRRLARELTKMGDAFLAAWDYLHEQQP